MIDKTDIIETTVMSKKKRHLYETMWGSDEFDFPTVKTNKRSTNSYSFSNASTNDKEACSNRLIELFKITNKDLFKEKFHQSCDGNGNEIKRIATLHSSALCALLFFYNVTETNPLRLKINNRDCDFVYSRFEFKTPVINNPSNMDIVLVGRYSDTGKFVILFLESKFSEYMERTGKHLKISSEYLNNEYSKEIYKDSILDKLSITKTYETGEEKFTIASTERCYLEGIKQMISHFIGVNNFISKGPVTMDALISSVREDADIYLGTILFDKSIGDYEIRKGVTCFESYKEKYEKLADILNSQATSVYVIRELFSYTMFENIDFIKEDKILEFYFKLTKPQT